MKREVRSVIASVIATSDDEMKTCTRFDSEFIEATGKVCVYLLDRRVLSGQRAL